MPHHQIHVTQRFSKPVEAIYATLANHENLGKVFGAPVKRIKEGNSDPNGVGSVRRIGPPPFGVQETVTRTEPNRLIEYKITRFGGPVMNHRGRLEFSSADDGSQVAWTIDFDSLPILGNVLETVLTQAIRRGLRKL